MPKSTLIFELPEDNFEYECATNGSKALFKLYDLDQALRSLEKYDGSSELNLELSKDATVYDVIEKIREYLWNDKLLDIIQ